MIYRDFKGMKLSALGMGCMRLPVIDGDFNKIDMDATRKMVDLAVKKGVNYFDTAWGYHGGNSEIAMGEVLKNYPRESFYLASKFPGYDLNNMDKVEEIFNQQLKKCGVDYFDFYLIHNVCELNVDEYLNPKHGILNYLLKQKANGKIRHFGFSTHGSIETMKRFLDVYGEHMEFCQIQLNWLDWKMQNAKGKVEMLNSYNLPIWVMEPIRGGKLATVSDEFTAPLKALRPEASTVEWSFRFLQTIPSVVVTLSGMSNMEQLEQNIETYRTEKPLSEREMQALFDVAAEMTKKDTLPCTACRYCTDHCPKGLDIPQIIELYNEHSFTGGGFLAPMMINSMPEVKRPSACVGCASCEAVCPQNIKISQMMNDFTEKLKK